MAAVTTPVAATVTGISEANGLNDVGAVVGQEDTVFPFVWNPQQPNSTTGTATQLPLLFTGGAPTGRAVSINSAGDICGSSEGLDANGNTVTRAVRWIGGAVQDLGTLIPDPFNPGNFLGNSRAIDINDAGQIVGASDTVVGSEHAFLFDPVLQVMRDLGSLALVPPNPAGPPASTAPVTSSGSPPRSTPPGTASSGRSSSQPAPCSRATSAH
ncbi:hypothetical protein ABZ079_29435 [Streptomyces sp. NPDC006314]|uniref:hypothetical protein n=1 Tax=Streptomyces sp. NPDC006314 TaxID=3154475 RepID=UPI0033AAC880